MTETETETVTDAAAAYTAAVAAYATALAAARAARDAAYADTDATDKAARHNRCMRTRAALVIAVLTVSGCAALTERDVTELACDEFAQYARAGSPVETRVSTVGSIGEIMPLAAAQLQEAHALLVNTQESPAEAWVIASDTFAAACFDLGWTS